jgi:site-specific DNA-methyltransferase (adenine-specific)
MQPPPLKFRLLSEHELICGSGTTCVASMLQNRNFIGIDKSEEAVKLSLSRIKNPIKTHSNLLKNGRRSYINADQDALALLKGIAFGFQ